MTRLLTVAEAALMLNVSEATVRALVSRKLIRHERIGLGRGQIRIPIDAIEEYRQSRAVQTNGGTPAKKQAAPKREPTIFKHIRVT
jgi:excisionase family DNA binding protein